MKLRNFLVSVIVLTLVFGGGYYLGQKKSSKGFVSISDVNFDRSVPEGKKVDFSLFWRVWDTLEANYYDKSKLNANDMVLGAIKGMVGAAGDPYTVFLPPDENKVVQEDLQGSFEGVGIQIGFKGTQLAVVAPLPGTPAEEAGIKAGDFIIGIKDENKDIDTNTTGISLPDAVEMIRGPKGTTVTLALLRDGVDEPIIVDVKRGDINVPSVIVNYEETDNGKVAHIRLLKFVGETNGEWDDAVNEVLQSNSDALVLDLRNNPGGYLQGAVDIAGEFLEQGSVVVYEEGPSGVRQPFKTDSFPRLKDMPTVVLVNEGSASASEILSGALREDAGIKLVGTTTFGKGTIQEPKQLENGAGLHITIAKWLTPKGNWVNEKGLEPDKSVEDNPETTEDEQLQEGIQLVLQ